MVRLSRIRLDADTRPFFPPRSVEEVPGELHARFRGLHAERAPAGRLRHVRGVNEAAGSLRTVQHQGVVVSVPFFSCASGWSIRALIAIGLRSNGVPPTGELARRMDVESIGT